jgi:predicted nucleic acid-binding protein
VIAVSNASPLITLARIGELGKIRNLFERVYISREVHAEVVVQGTGMPGAATVAAMEWIRVVAVEDTAAVLVARAEHGLGAGETSAVQLALEMNVPIVLMDERRGRRYAKRRGLDALGCVGLLEGLFRRGDVPDLRRAYLDLLAVNARFDIGTLRQSLAKLGQPLF